MKILKFINKNWYRLFNLLFLFVIAVSILKIAVQGINIVNIKNISDDLGVIINEKSKINIIGNDLGLHEAPLWVHVETYGEYNKRLDNSIKAYEHDYKMQHDENYRKTFNDKLQKRKQELNIE